MTLSRERLGLTSRVRPGTKEEVLYGPPEDAGPRDPYRCVLSRALLGLYRVTQGHLRVSPTSAPPVLRHRRIPVADRPAPRESFPTVGTRVGCPDVIPCTPRTSLSTPTPVTTGPSTVPVHYLSFLACPVRPFPQSSSPAHGDWTPGVGEAILSSGLGTVRDQDAPSLMTSASPHPGRTTSPLDVRPPYQGGGPSPSTDRGLGHSLSPEIHRPHSVPAHPE